MTNIVLGDDHTIFVESLVSILLSEGFSVPAAAASLQETIEAVHTHRPEVCLLDRHFADGDGVAAIGDVRAANPGTRVLVLTADRDTDAMLRAIKMGATGYVHKTWGIHALIEAVKRVVAGDIVIDAPRQHRQRPLITEARRLATHLTTRERECLALLVEGLDTRGMTDRLGVSATTIRSHVQGVLSKLGVHSRLEAASLAVRYNLVEHDRMDLDGIPPTDECAGGGGR
ncbi:MAG TPA: response regulator transcription factor [Pseudonocardiaceae bacterium]|jgi:DNA-binding NarL/FixJ family response regulator